MMATSRGPQRQPVSHKMQRQTDVILLWEKCADVGYERNRPVDHDLLERHTTFRQRHARTRLSLPGLIFQTTLLESITPTC
jgi:hypothetical protein